MSTQTVTPTTTNAATNPVIVGLKKVLADSYALFGQTHLAHWNVEGPEFFQLHAAFQTQYEELFTAIDDLAERIRALDAYAPGGLTTLAKESDISEMSTGAAPAKDFVAHLIESHEALLANLEKLKKASEETHDLETQDIAIGRIQTHQKTLWMLKSFLKNL